MILGTHTSENEPNYLMLAQVQLPLEDAENDARHYDDDRSEFGGFGCANGKVQLSSKSIMMGRSIGSYMPQTHLLLPPRQSVQKFMFLISKHPSKPPLDGACNPDLRLRATVLKGMVCHGVSQAGPSIEWF
ncbi:UNVERIFIED_CONTAM: WD-40 repeat-containing protein MSI1 [Sesamum angustifolium]|uniref:WD-40 repeat-containing protein MSI1 n=1 Tax=Sesamum angustifolium TaxID=2727405 RepID=A0AAW2NYI1_9LAMI